MNKKMNKYRKWFYDKAKNNMDKEIEEYGLRMIDDEKYHKKILKASKKDIIYTTIMILFLIILIIRWVI